jgi:hypothetical protein
LKIKEAIGQPGDVIVIEFARCRTKSRIAGSITG